MQADMIVVNPSSWSMMPVHDWYNSVSTKAFYNIPSQDL